MDDPRQQSSLSVREQIFAHDLTVEIKATNLPPHRDVNREVSSAVEEALAIAAKPITERSTRSSAFASQLARLLHALSLRVAKRELSAFWITFSLRSDLISLAIQPGPGLNLTVSVFSSGLWRADSSFELLPLKLGRWLTDQLAALETPLHASNAIRMAISPGSATTEEIADFLIALQRLHIAAGGNGFAFDEGTFFPSPSQSGASR
jgi:hypothetical protein